MNYCYGPCLNKSAILIGTGMICLGVQCFTNTVSSSCILFVLKMSSSCISFCFKNGNSFMFSILAAKSFFGIFQSKM